jgi:hypothetical protein
MDHKPIQSVIVKILNPKPFADLQDAEDAYLAHLSPKYKEHKKKSLSSPHKHKKK